MKTKILSVILANIIITGFITFTVFMQFGTNIKVLKKVEVYPIDVDYSQTARYSRFYGGNGIIYSSTCLVKLEPTVNEIKPFWVDAKDFFNSDDEEILQRMVDNKEIIKMNIFVNSKTNEVLGVTKRNTSKLALIYRNNKPVKFGSIIIPCVDLFVIGLIMLFEKKCNKRTSSEDNKDNPV